MADEKKGFMSRLFGRKKEHEPQEPKVDETSRPDQNSPQVAEDMAPDVGRGAEREVHSATVEEDTEAGEATFLHETPADKGGLAEDDEEETRSSTPAEGEAQEPQSADSVPEPEVPAVAEPPKKRGFFGRLSAGLAKTSAKLTG
ncbi:MAG: hypothetical protein AAF368_09410, partial [Planctomycetota bacterium]